MSRDIAAGDTVHVKGCIAGVSSNFVRVKFDFFHELLFVDWCDIAYHEPAPLSVGDTVLSKDGVRGEIKCIEDDWAVVVAKEKHPAIRYLIDLQRVS